MPSAPVDVETPLPKRLVLTTVIFFAGCAQQHISNTGVDYVSPEQNIISAISSQPLEVLVPFENDRYAWERVEYFAYEVMKVKSLSISRNSVSGELLAIAPSAVGSFEIRKRLIPNQGFRYTVKCQEQSQSCVLQSQNLARFLDKGTLERSIIK